MSPSARSGAHGLVRIGDRLVGEGQPVLVIAEAGVNHDGSVEQALRLVDVAADAGADVVKFQVFRAAELTTASAAAARYQAAQGATSQREMLARLELSDDDYARVARRCRERGVEFLATPFGVADVDRLLKLGVRAIKIASTDLNNLALLGRAAATNLPLIVSTGASTSQEIDAAIARLRDWGAEDRCILLHCVSGYPVPLAAANLRAVAALSRRSGWPSGFSDHTPSTEIAGWAVAAGACVLEKHFTHDTRAAGPDHAMSLDPARLAEYIAIARAADEALGTGQLGYVPLEEDVRRVARKSMVSAAHIPAGTVLTEALLAAKRPGGGIPPDQVERLLGRKAAADIAPDTVLTWDLVR